MVSKIEATQRIGNGNSEQRSEWSSFSISESLDSLPWYVAVKYIASKTTEVEIEEVEQEITGDNLVSVFVTSSKGARILNRVFAIPMK